MIEAVFDTNVIVAGFASPLGVPGRRLDYAGLGAVHLVVSEHILTELGIALREPYFRARFTERETENALELVRKRATIVEITDPLQGVASHSSDDPVVATAVNAGAQYLVTGDRELRRLGRYRNVTILTPQEFLPLVEADITEPDPA